MRMKALAPVGSVASYGRRFSVLALVLAATAALAVETASAALSSNLTLRASLGAKMSYDSNVFLQDKPDGDPALSERDSFVATVSPAVGLSYEASPAFRADLDYTPDFAWYLSESSEDNIIHRSKINLGGEVSDLTWKLNNTIVPIDGDDRSLVWTGVGGPPAAGGIPVRNRRDALIYLSSFQLRYPIKQFFVRPVMAYYLHDFQVEQLNIPGYLNFVDRDDLNGGLDVGWQVAAGTYLTLGYRYGHQDQDTLAWSPLEYSNDYQRVLAGIEGQPWSWLKLAFTAGPDFRDYGPNISPTVDLSRTVFYLDGSFTITPSANDTITIKAKHYRQPAFGGRAIYDDDTYAINWRHTLDSAWTVGLGFQAYGTDFTEVGPREDWIFTPSALVSWKMIQRLTAELSYTFDWSDSGIPNTPSREFTRHIVNLGLRYAFSP